MAMTRRDFNMIVEESFRHSLLRYMQKNRIPYGPRSCECIETIRVQSSPIWISKSDMELYKLDPFILTNVLALNFGLRLKSDMRKISEARSVGIDSAVVHGIGGAPLQAEAVFNVW